MNIYQTWRNLGGMMSNNLSFSFSLLNSFSCSLYLTLATVETDANIFGAKGSAQGLRNLQDFVIPSHLTAARKIQRTSLCELQLQEVCLTGGSWLSTLLLQAPLLFFLWARDFFAKQSTWPWKTGFKIHQHNEASHCSVQRCSPSKHYLLSVWSNLTSKYAVRREELACIWSLLAKIRGTNIAGKNTNLPTIVLQLNHSIVNYFYWLLC